MNMAYQCDTRQGGIMQGSNDVERHALREVEMSAKAARVGIWTGHDVREIATEGSSCLLEAWLPHLF